MVVNSKYIVETLNEKRIGTNEAKGKGRRIPVSKMYWLKLLKFTYSNVYCEKKCKKEKVMKEQWTGEYFPWLHAHPLFKFITQL